VFPLIFCLVAVAWLPLAPSGYPSGGQPRHFFARDTGSDVYSIKTGRKADPIQELPQDLLKGKRGRFG